METSLYKIISIDRPAKHSPLLSKMTIGDLFWPSAKRLRNARYIYTLYNIHVHILYSGVRRSGGKNFVGYFLSLFNNTKCMNKFNFYVFFISETKITTWSIQIQEEESAFLVYHLISLCLPLPPYDYFSYNTSNQFSFLLVLK